jgi:hypothetical protein
VPTAAGNEIGSPGAAVSESGHVLAGSIVCDCAHQQMYSGYLDLTFLAIAALAMQGFSV